MTKHTQYRKLVAERFGLTEAPPSGAPISRPQDKRVSMEPRTQPMGTPPMAAATGKDPNKHEDEYEDDIVHMDDPDNTPAKSRLGQIIVKALKTEAVLDAPDVQPGQVVIVDIPGIGREKAKVIQVSPDGVLVRTAYPANSKDFKGGMWLVGQANVKTEVVTRKLKEADQPHALSHGGGSSALPNKTHTELHDAQLSDKEVSLIDQHAEDIQRFAQKVFGTKPLAQARRVLCAKLEALGIDNRNSGAVVDIMIHLYHLDTSPETHIFQKVLPRIAQMPNIKGGGFYSGGSPGPFQPLG